MRIPVGKPSVRECGGCLPTCLGVCGAMGNAELQLRRKSRVVGSDRFLLSNLEPAQFMVWGTGCRTLGCSSLGSRGVRCGYRTVSLH